MDIEKLLWDFGLTKYEAAAYLNIYKGGGVEASAIYKEAKIPIGKIYETLGTLESKGLIEVQNTRPKRYKAKKPKFAFNHLFNEKKKHMEMDLQRTRVVLTQIGEELDKINVKHRNEKLFWTTAVDDEVGKLIISNFEDSEKDICTLLYHKIEQNHKDQLEGHIPSIISEVIKATKRGVKVRGLLSKEFADSQVNIFKKFNVREETVKNINIRTVDNPIPAYFTIIDSEKVILQVDDPIDQNKIMTMTKIWDVKLADKLKKKFDEMWEEAKPFKLIG